MIGILDYDMHHIGWFVRYQIASDIAPNFLEYKSTPIYKPENYKLVVDDHVDFGLKFLNPMGREIDPMDLQKNLSGCKWYAVLKETDNIKKTFKRFQLVNKYPGSPELGYILEGEDCGVRGLTYSKEGWTENDCKVEDYPLHWREL